MIIDHLPIWVLRELNISLPLIKGAQIGPFQSAPIIFPTPFCENRYQIIAALAERCCYFCKVSPFFGDNRVIFTKFSVLHKTFTAFAYRIRAPPSEV